jgi:hypothetical protein
VNLLGDTTHAIKENTETLIDASKEVALEENTEKTKCTLLSRHQIAGQSYDIKIANRCFENVAKFTYLGTIITNRNLIQRATATTGLLYQPRMIGRVIVEKLVE